MDGFCLHAVWSEDTSRMDSLSTWSHNVLDMFGDRHVARYENSQNLIVVTRLMVDIGGGCWKLCFRLLSERSRDLDRLRTKLLVRDHCSTFSNSAVLLSSFTDGIMLMLWCCNMTVQRLQQSLWNFYSNGHRLWDHAVQFARWQHPAVECGARFAGTIIKSKGPQIRFESEFRILNPVLRGINAWSNEALWGMSLEFAVRYTTGRRIFISVETLQRCAGVYSNRPTCRPMEKYKNS